MAALCTLSSSVNPVVHGNAATPPKSNPGLEWAIYGSSKRLYDNRLQKRTMAPRIPHSEVQILSVCAGVFNEGGSITPRSHSPSIPRSRAAVSRLPRGHLYMCAFSSLLGTAIPPTSDRERSSSSAIVFGSLVIRQIFGPLG